jgi:hypothetical protein
VVASNWQRSLSYAPAKNIKLFCEFPFAPNPPLVPRASEHDVGGDSDPKGAIADDRDVDKDAKDRKNYQRERRQIQSPFAHPVMVTRCWAGKTSTCNQTVMSGVPDPDDPEKSDT